MIALTAVSWCEISGVGSRKIYRLKTDHNSCDFLMCRPGMWKRLFRQPLPLPHLPLPTEPILYLINELADKHDYQNQQLAIYKHAVLVKMIAEVSICQHGTAALL